MNEPVLVVAAKGLFLLSVVYMVWCLSTIVVPKEAQPLEGEEAADQEILKWALCPFIISSLALVVLFLALLPPYRQKLRF